MSSDEDKYSVHVAHNNSDPDSSVSTDLQEEYEELLRYAIVNPNVDPSASQPSHPKGEAAPGNNPVKETAMEVGKGCDNSSHSKSDAHEMIVGDRLVSDENLQKVENVLDLWSSGLKTNIISELSKWRLNFIDWHRMEMKKEKERHAALVKQLSNQIADLKELQKAFEISIGRKDEVISSLSHAIGKQKERIELMKTFFHWRIGHVKSRQEVYEGKLADQYFQRTLLKKVWKGWRSVVQRQWKEVVERACQARAEEVCVQLSNDYEAKLAMLSGALENAKAEIQRMQQEKEHFEDSMKKAFMRGVCALNLEAMTIFQNKNDAGIDFTSNKKEESGPGGPGRELSAHLDTSSSTIPSAIPSAVPSQLLPSAAAAAGGGASASVIPSAASMTSAGATSASSIHIPVSVLGAGPAAAAAPEEMYMPRVVTSAQQKAGKTITARITGRCDFASKTRINSSLAIMGVSPPMSSVVVEKHHPVTVQTIPQAAAAKYPRTIHSEGGIPASRSLGARPTHTQSLSSVQSIKVVD
ncbi:centrosomal protein POC5 isoform X2 [Onychomys torridus]|uniref:centrosomal protein POC5 isoform X2 n=1 Tax=Onychomys torridus TaxID=38674 RepID=UPI00167F46A3|nr:centrosomal protein POC5 isoform X2 [Onychomys torridus]